MDYDIKNRWIKALCSGAYTQGVGLLRQEDGVGHTHVRHCCIGVLCELVGMGTVVNGKLVLPSDNTGAPTEEEAIALGLTQTLVDELVTLNDDHGRSFQFIAGWIDATVPVEYS